MPNWPSGRLAALLLSAFVFAAPLHAHPDDATRDTTFVSLVRGTELGVGALIQTDGIVAQENAPDGFDVRVARLRLRGAARSVQFFVQTDFVRSPVLLDARLRLPISPTLTLTAGLFKTPFSREELTSRIDLHFLERSRIVNMLAPPRQVGVALQAELIPARVTLQGGVFNGTDGRSRLNDNDSFLYVTRLTGAIPFDAGSLQVGANGGYSRDEDVALSPLSPSFGGRRWLVGIDAALHWKQWLLAGEWITASLDATDGPTYHPSGYHITTGYRLQERHQFLLRADVFEDDRADTEDTEQLLIGYNFFWTAALKIQINYAAPFDALDAGFAGARLQLALN